MNPGDVPGPALPDMTQARLDASRRIVATVEAAVGHARIEDFGSLVHALESAHDQVNHVQAFDRALVRILVDDNERASAADLISNRDSTGGFVPDPVDLPF